ncbi:MAG: aspartate carbamoyltransferase [Thermodesulfovibrio sp. RBG_19FT_COMBO_42_12]|nr:MAG: aspartate carbamoyltransferase [Thermodesulfovibrio sp. RBG_19FT_COMBO_42_12]
MELNRKDLLEIKELSGEEILSILNTAESFKEVTGRDIKKVPTLRGKTVVNLFFEPSTRTRTSFELAAKRLSADVINFSVATSSVTKGETLLDTARNIEAMRSDYIVIRHPASGAPHILAKNLKSSVINAGDGAHEHPTQALLDMFTIKEKKGRIAGLKIAIIGDIAHSRVARSNIYGLTRLGAEVRLVGPPALIPPEVEGLGVSVFYNMEDALMDVDVIMVLRLQLERQGKNYFPSLREYAGLYSLTPERVKSAKEDVMIMHPGPINRGIEIAPDVADGMSSVILEQVTNGIAVRMAVLYLLSGAGEHVT